MKNLSVAIIVTCGTDALPAFQECSPAVTPEGAVSAEWVHLGSSTDRFGEQYTDNSQITLAFLLKWMWYGQAYYVWKGTSSEDPYGTGWFEMCGKENEMQLKLDNFLCMT